MKKTRRRRLYHTKSRRREVSEKLQRKPYLGDTEFASIERMYRMKIQRQKQTKTSRIVSRKVNYTE